MNTSIVLSLDARRPKADGTCPIILRITHHSKVSQINTGFSIKETDWNEQERCIKPSYKGTESVTRLNNFLQKKKAEALDIITKLDERKTLNSYTVVQLKQVIERKPDQTSFFAYATQLINKLNEANKLGNARAYKSGSDALRKFAGRDLTFYEVNLSLLQRFETDHFKKGNKINGLSAYMRSIRAIYNQAIKAKLVDKELYPFADYEIKSEKTRKRAISIESIRKFEEKTFDVEHPFFHTRNYFLLSFYLRGMSFIDLAELKMSDWIDGRIYYQRRKMHKPYNVKVTDKVREILEYYGQGKQKDDFILPIIKRETPEERYKDVEWARRRFNKKLKKIAELLGIQEDLTSYVARHTFATRAKNLGIPIANISEMLGHGDTKTTEIYLDSLPSDVLDDFHEKVLK